MKMHALLEENTPENLGKMNTFSRKCDLPKLFLEDIENPKRSNCKNCQFTNKLIFPG